MIVGGIHAARGACPVCGSDVARMHKWNGARVGDLYRCPDCGETEYRAGEPLVAPLRVPGRIPAVLERILAA